MLKDNKGKLKMSKEYNEGLTSEKAKCPQRKLQVKKCKICTKCYKTTKHCKYYKEIRECCKEMLKNKHRERQE